MTTADSKSLVSTLKTENRTLHRRIAKLEAKLISYQSRVDALEKEIKSGNNREIAKLLDEISHNEHATGSKRS